MPKDHYSKQNAVNRTTRSTNKPRFLTRPLRKCPSCRQDAVIETNIMSEKVILRCRHCHLRYELTRFPIFEEVDYYNKMLDIYRTENWTRKSDKSSIINKNVDKSSDDRDTSQENSSNCPICKIGNLWASTYFIRGYQIIKCNNDDCHATFQAPKGGYFQVSEDRCVTCGWPIIISKDNLVKNACFNPNCIKHGIITNELNITSIGEEQPKSRSLLTEMAKVYFLKNGYKINCENASINGYSGTPHHFDLLLQKNGVEQGVWVQDWNRTIGINVIIALDNVAEDVELINPIIIGDKFSSHAKAYARRRKIEILTKQKIETLR